MVSAFFPCLYLSGTIRLLVFSKAMHIGLKRSWSAERLPVCLSLALFHTDRFNRGDCVAFGMLWVDQHIDRLSQFHWRRLRDIGAELVRRIGPGVCPLGNDHLSG